MNIELSKEDAVVLKEAALEGVRCVRKTLAKLQEDESASEDVRFVVGELVDQRELAVDRFTDEMAKQYSADGILLLKVPVEHANVLKEMLRRGQAAMLDAAVTGPGENRMETAHGLITGMQSQMTEQRPDLFAQYAAKTKEKNE
jgi:hypothetical protein